MPVSDHHTEQELISQLRAGENAAFTSIYDRYHFAVFQYSRRWLGQTEEAEDVTAETFIKLFNGRKEMESLDRVAAFLFVVTRNACLDRLEKSRTRAGKLAELQWEQQADTDPATDWLDAQEGLLELIYAEVEKMPPQVKTVFLLSYKEGLKPAEIAERLQIHVHTVSNHKTNAVRMLRAAFVHHPLTLVLLYVLEQEMTGR